MPNINLQTITEDEFLALDPNVQDQLPFTARTLGVLDECIYCGVDPDYIQFWEVFGGSAMVCTACGCQIFNDNQTVAELTGFDYYKALG